MMGNPLDWRRIEAELEDIARKNGFRLDRTDGRDKVVIMGKDDCDEDISLNLTELAKELADRLGGK